MNGPYALGQMMLLNKSTPHNKPLTFYLRQRLTQGMLASLNTRSDLVLLLIHTRLQHVGAKPHHRATTRTQPHNCSQARQTGNTTLLAHMPG